MRIEQLMTKSPKSCQPGDTLDEAAQMMWDRDCGCLPVAADDGSQRVIGMITDRDICMAAHFHGRPLTAIRVADAMARDVWACNPGDAPCEAEAIMREARVRRLPVVDEANQLLGLISLADLAREAERQHWKRKREITVAEVGDVLAMICRPRDLVRPAPED
jgi:CBS domain-containing protein